MRWNFAGNLDFFEELNFYYSINFGEFVVQSYQSSIVTMKAAAKKHNLSIN